MKTASIPSADDRQRLVYPGHRAARQTDATAGFSNDIAYYYPDDFSYYYSVFARGDDGNLHLQLTVRAAPRSVGSWQRPGCEGDDESPQETGDVEIDREIADLSRR